MACSIYQNLIDEFHKEKKTLCVWYDFHDVKWLTDWLINTVLHRIRQYFSHIILQYFSIEFW